MHGTLRKNAVIYKITINLKCMDNFKVDVEYTKNARELHLPVIWKLKQGLSRLKLLKFGKETE